MEFKSIVLTSLDRSSATGPDEVHSQIRSQLRRTEHLPNIVQRNIKYAHGNSSLPLSTPTTERPSISLGSFQETIYCSFTDLAQEMIAAYSDVKTRACIECGKLLDGKPQVPVIRRKRDKPDSSSNDGRTWDALHESCA